MKKLLVLMISCLSFCNVRSQERSRGFEEVTFGGLMTLSAAHNFNDTAKNAQPFLTDVTYALSLNTNTLHTHHHVWYNFSHHCMETLNGVFLSKDRRLDVYVFYSQPLGKDESVERYLSAGIEKFLDIGLPEAKDELEFILFAELGTNLKEKTFVTCGIVVHPQIRLWNKENRKRKRMPDNSKG